MNKRFIPLLLTLVISLSVSSCATSTAEKPTVNVHTESSRGVGIHQVTAYWDEEGLRISGKLHRKSFPVSKSTGHIDIHILDGFGKTIKIVHVEPTPGMFFRRTVMKPRFSTLVTVEPNNDFIVKVKHHAKSISVHESNAGDA